MKKADRLNQELIFLRDKSHFQLKDLITTFHISKRTALRDITSLGTMGLPYYTEPGRYGGYRLVRQVLLTPIYFTLDESRAIFFALNAMTALSSTPFEHSYAQIREKVFATLPHNQQQLIDKMDQVVYFYTTAPIQQITNLELLLRAILNDQILTGVDNQHDSEIVQLQPYELFYRNGIWFCSAQNWATNKWGTYRCDYLSQLNFDTKSRFTPVSRDILKAKQDAYEHYYHDIHFRCRLSGAGREHFLRNHYPNMHLEKHNDIFYLVGGYNQTELSYMAHYLLSYGPNILVETPKQLQSTYLELLKSIQSQYTDA